MIIMIIMTIAYLTSIEVVRFLDFIGIDTRGNTNHPEELVNIITTVTNETSENDKHVINIQTANDGVCLLFTACQGLFMRT